MNPALQWFVFGFVCGVFAAGWIAVMVVVGIIAAVKKQQREEGRGASSETIG